MAISRPFRRTCRQFTDGKYALAGKWMYLLHPKFAKEPEHYTRAFEIIQKDLLELFDYVEPADQNLQCYSFRTHALFMRVCIEVEANCKAILTENDYIKSGVWNMDDYKLLERTHLLSGFEIKLPVWRGRASIRRPFAGWSTSGSLSWYKAYNASKHDRHEEFSQAKFDNLLDAICGLVALLSAQFYSWDYSPAPPVLSAVGIGGPPPGFTIGIGRYFLVRFPDWPTNEQYDFDWDAIKGEADPFRTHTF